MLATKHIHFAKTESTMEIARKMDSKEGLLLVTAETQTKGRGTKGRPWQSPQGNIYLTVSIPSEAISPTRIELLPLEIGIWLHTATIPWLALEYVAGLKLKWPNDLLWNGRKVAGTLIELTGNLILIGVGINVAIAPPILDGGTASECLLSAGAHKNCALPLAKAFMTIIQTELSNSPKNIIELWSANALWETGFYLRDRESRALVNPVKLNAQGHLQVRFKNGTEEWLISEYLA